MYLDHLPSANFYERSYMHVGDMCHVRTTKTDFIITASVDGQLKFWKKKPKEVEFVKRFYAHVGPITDMGTSTDGVWLCTVGSKDMVLNVFDVINFDMVNMVKLGFRPSCCEWIAPSGSNRMLVAVGSKDGPEVRVYDCKGAAKEPIKVFTGHRAPVVRVRYHPGLQCVISVDQKGLIEMWDADTLGAPEGVTYKYKSDTDLYELAKGKTTAYSVDISPDGELFACVCADKLVRVWRCATGKLYKKIDETISTIQSVGAACKLRWVSRRCLQTDCRHRPISGNQSICARTPLPAADSVILAGLFQSQGDDESLKIEPIDFGRRMAVEKELDAARDKDPDCAMPNCVFDQSSKLLLFPSPIGIKVMNLVENKVVRIIGKPEANERFLGMSLMQNAASKRGEAPLFSAERFLAGHMGC